MENPMGVRGRNPAANRAHQVVGFGQHERSPFEALFERRPFDVLGHDEDRSAFVDAQFEQPHDRRVVERLEGGPFASKSPAHLVVCEVLDVKHFGGHAIARSPISREIHRADGAERKLPAELVAFPENVSDPDPTPLLHRRDKDTALFPNPLDSRTLDLR